MEIVYYYLQFSRYLGSGLVVFEHIFCSAVDAAVAEVLAERADFVTERGMEALGPLMGVVMGKLGGAADGKAVSAALKEQIQRLL